MERSIALLAPSETRALAAARLGATTRLVAEAAEALPALAEAARRPFLLALSAPGLPAAWLQARGGGVRAHARKPPASGLPSLVLRFPSVRACARILAGGGGSPFPVFAGPGAGAALRYFALAASRAPALLADPGTEAPLRARLLAAAALGGLAALAGSDPALADRLDHVPDGTIVVEAPGAFALGLGKKGRSVSVLDAPPTAPNARLAFRDAASAVAVLSGKRPAVVALGAGEVAMGGLVPLAQGLFAVLDRLGEYLAIPADKETR